LGTWNDEVRIKDSLTGKEEVVLKADARPENSDRQYFFGYYAINLNYVNDEMRRALPPTDTRRRGD
jgi:hypothetical protein